MNWVIDASVALKWFLRFTSGEEHVREALYLLEQALSGVGRVVQPPHFYAEMAAVLARLKPATAEADLNDLLQMGFRVMDESGLYAVGIELSQKYDHHLFDTLYHAVALTCPNTTLVTADRRYFEKAKKAGHICFLGEATVR